MSKLLSVSDNYDRNSIQRINMDKFICVCCLNENITYIKLSTCSHSGFINNFICPEMNLSNQLVCNQCHNMLKKIELFKLQVNESLVQLTQVDRNKNLIRPKIRLKIQHVSNLSIDPIYIKEEIVEEKLITVNENMDEDIDTMNQEENLDIDNIDSEKNTTIDNRIKIETFLDEPFNDMSDTNQKILAEQSDNNLKYQNNQFGNDSKTKMIKIETGIDSYNNEEIKNEINENGPLQSTGHSLLLPLPILDIKYNPLSKETIPNLNSTEYINTKEYIHTNLKRELPEKFKMDDHNTFTNKKSLENIQKALSIINSNTNNNCVNLLTSSLNNFVGNNLIGSITNNITNSISNECVVKSQNDETNKIERESNDLPSYLKGYIDVVNLSNDQLMAERKKISDSESYLKYSYRCKHCLIGFNYKDNYDDHIKRTHTDKNDGMMCSVCRQVFYSDAHLKMHEDRHYIRYRCVLCSNGNEFDIMDEAAKHILTKHPKKIANKTREEKLKELQRKRSRERQRAYYQRQKDLKKKEKKKKKKDKLPKSNAVRQREFRQRNAEKSYLNMKKQKLETNENNIVPCTPIENMENSISQQLKIYEQRIECATPKIILHRNTRIPSDGNCLFHSLISVLHLKIDTCELRSQLRDSPFLNTCHNPQEAYRILSNKNSYGDLDCIYLFTKVYNKNVCVHFTFYNITKNTQDTIYCYLKANNNESWIHLHLEEQHFTPLTVLELQNAKKVHLISNKLLNDSYDDITTDNSEKDEIDTDNKMDYIVDDKMKFYTDYKKHTTSHIDFYKEFTSNSFGHSCVICDRLYWKSDLKMSDTKHESILKVILQNYTPGEIVQVCSSCHTSLEKDKIPLMSTYNGFAYPKIPSHLPKLNIIEKSLMSPRIPFIQIHRLRHVYGQNNIYAQTMNIPIEINTTVNQLPRHVDKDHCIYVNLKKKLIHKTNYIQSLINKNHINDWLTYLVTTPLYKHHDIKIDESFFTDYGTQLNIDEISEHVPVEDSLFAQQQTLLSKNDRFLNDNKRSHSLIDEHAEELSFPTIYGGQFRTYRDGITVTPYMQATSEIRRTDRRATDPQHLLYIAAKIMKLRVSRCVNVALNCGDMSVTTETLQSEVVGNCSERKKDLFAMIRQLGSPTAFMSVNANETGWVDLLRLLYKLKNDGAEVTDDILADMSYMDKAKLVNEDAVTCAIYFNKMLNCMLKVLQSKKRNPFGKYRVVHYFKRIEFQRIGSPRANILFWLDNVPEILGNNHEVIKFIDELVSVSESEASGNIKLITHKHTDMCYKKLNKTQDCKFGAPFMPSKTTIRLIPLKQTDADYSETLSKEYKKQFVLIRKNLENFDYANFDEFYSHNAITSDEHYYNIIRAGINKSILLYKRKLTEKWYNTFNPFVLHHLKTFLNFQIILDEYACGECIVEYFNERKKGISYLQRQIIDLMDQHSELNVNDITKTISNDILESVEMSTQEAAWFLLREPVAKPSVAIVYIPTELPTERTRFRKSMKKFEYFDEDCNIVKDNLLDKYEKRPKEIHDVTLAQFVAKYYVNKKGRYSKRDSSRIIRYKNYNMADNYNDFRREMVLLHYPFQSEENDIIVDDKYIEIYEKNKDIISERRKEFESNMDIEKILEICRQFEANYETQENAE